MSVANIYHHKIRGPRHKRNFHFGELFVQISAALIDRPLCLAQMLFILERGERADLSDAVHVKRLPRFVKHLDQISRPNGIPDAQASESVNLRKCAQDNNVSSFANESQRIRGTIEEFEIGFIENDDDSLRNMRHEVVDLALRKQRSRWIIRVWNKNEPSFRRDRSQHYIQVLLVIRARDFNCARAKQGGDQFVDDKRVLSRDDVVTGIEKRVTKKFEHFI